MRDLSGLWRGEGQELSTMMQIQTTEADKTRGRILIVDDEPSVCRLLNEKLSCEGFVCKDCTRSEEALALLTQQAFDAVISDLRMPGISGLELLRQARQTDRQPAFLMVTGVDDIRVGIQAMKEGADDYLVKPFQMDAVLLSVTRALEKRNLERELADHRKHLEEMINQRTRQLQVALKRIEQTYEDTLEALAASLDLRDDETAGHSRRVMRYSLEIAWRMECTPEQMRNIARGAYLHDIGKIGVPDAILLKPAKLTEEDRQIMEGHVRAGYEVVCRVAFLANAAEIVLTHHERFDGTGYPQGLRGNEIPLGSRIFAVADTLDAMTSDRPYRRALPYSAAREEITRQSGRQFDPTVVQAFLTIPEETLAVIRQGQRALEPRHGIEAPWTARLSPAQPAGREGCGGGADHSASQGRNSTP
jgi:response regulator RpfG family c-di-GMP phosphodiesterase